MHAIGLLHKFLKKTGVIAHEKRLTSLLNAIGGLLNGAKLSLTSIGRHMHGPAKVKHKIKSSYNLLTNGKLHAERFAIYKALSEKLLINKSEIDVLVDWSPCIHHDNQILKASVVLRGKSMTLYEEVHPEAKLGNYEVHRLFLKKLKLMIPKNIKVTVMTDAGFRTEWFGLIRKMGWDFTGRVRGKIFYKTFEDNVWATCGSAHQFATNTPSYHGEVLLSKETQLPCFMYLYKESKDLKSTPQGFNLLLTSLPGDLSCINIPNNKAILIKNNDKYYIHGNSDGNQWKFTELDSRVIEHLDLNFPKDNIIEKLPYHKAYKKLYEHIRAQKGHISIKKKQPSNNHKDYQKSANEPWLIVSSHGPALEHINDRSCIHKEQKSAAIKIIKQYATRMKIEHEFRSTKNSQYGIGLSYSRSMDPNSLQMLLLIGHLHLFLLWLIGLATEYDKKHFNYQANTVKTHRVLSLVFLGMQVILHNIEAITEDILMNALEWGTANE